jgi:hypothetical protein
MSTVFLRNLTGSGGWGVIHDASLYLGCNGFDGSRFVTNETGLGAVPSISSVLRFVENVLGKGFDGEGLEPFISLLFRQKSL